jgi:hypothetical protein
MTKLLTALALTLLVANVALADARPPVPKGYKDVTVSNEVVLGKDVTGYVFIKRTSTFPGGGNTHVRLDLTADKAVTLPAAARRTAVALVAVPRDAAKEFKTDAELFDALRANKVKGVQTLALPGSAIVADSVKDGAVKWTYTITGIDEKGIKATVAGDGADKVLDKKKDKAPAPVSTLVAGGAAALALTFGGLWLTGRARRKV